MATTYTGRLVHPTNYGVPSPIDMAVALFRMPRFMGATRLPWSVGHHLLACDWYAAKALSETDGGLSYEGRRKRVALLTHDGEEACTGDIPTTWKVDAVRALVLPLKVRIWHFYSGQQGGPLSTEEVAWVKEVDRALFLAESLVVGPPSIREHSGMDLVQPEPEAVAAVERVLGLYGNPNDFMYEHSAAVCCYLRNLRDAMGKGTFGRLTQSMGQYERTEALL